jgi:hypothetical protein
MDTINSLLDNFLFHYNSLMKNPTFSTFIIVFISLYAAQLAPTLPNFVTIMFKNTLFKMLFIFVIAINSNHNPQLSLLFSVIFVLSINAITDQEHNLALSNVEKFNNIDKEYDIYYNDNFISDSEHNTKPSFNI